MKNQPLGLAALRTEIVRGIDRHNRARRARRRAASAVVAAMAVVMSAILSSTGGVTPALAIERSSDTLVLRILDATASAHEMTQELRDAGVDASVDVLAVSPSLVGRWVGAEQIPSADDDRAAATDYSAAMQRDAADSEALRQMTLTDDELIIPLRQARNLAGRLHLYAGRAPDPGETYAISASAFAPGEPLHCSGIERLSPAQARAAVEQRGYRVRWHRDPAHGATVGDPKGRITDARLVDAQYVSSAGGETPSPRDIVVYTSATGSDRPPQIPNQDCG